MRLAASPRLDMRLAASPRLDMRRYSGINAKPWRCRAAYRDFERAFHKIYFCVGIGTESCIELGLRFYGDHASLLRFEFRI
jgi:hypothetical protein